MKARLHDWMMAALCVLMFPLIMLAAGLVTWVFKGCIDDQGDD